MQGAPRLIAHLDLKGVRYRPAYYEAYFANLKALGYDAVLVEYEDAFPFAGAALSRHPGEVWTPEFLRGFLALAREAGVEVIPLQQCLGHLEYAFFKPDYQRYALAADPLGIPRNLDIGNPQASRWAAGLLEEVLLAHPESRWVHLGMDEAVGLTLHARKTGKDVVTLFLDYLESLCALCERHGKTPLIWADMLEEHLEPRHLERIRSFRERVILVPWNYSATGEPQSVVTFSGARCSRRWRLDPWNGPAGPVPLREGLRFFEEWPPEIGALVAPYRESPWQVEPLFSAGIWKRLGFRVVGGAGGTITEDRSLLPYYHRRMANLRHWGEVARREGLEGVIVTQWARSNSCTVPNLIPNVAWPILAAIGGRESFFPDVPEETLERLFFSIGKCREEWRVEDSLIAEMEQLLPSLTRHREEWESILLMLKVQAVYHELETVFEFVRCYGRVRRLPEAGWMPRLQTLRDLRERLAALEARIRHHLSARYAGAALEEWFCNVFTGKEEEIAWWEGQMRRSIITAWAPLPAASAEGESYPLATYGQAMLLTAEGAALSEVQPEEVS